MRSLAYSPSLLYLLDSTLYTFEQTVEQDLWQSTIHLRNQLQKHRCLLVLDGLEAVFDKQENEVLTALEKRSLLEKRLTKDEQLFTLQPLIMKVVTEQLIEQAVEEISQVVQNSDICHFKVLRTHWLLRPGTDDIVGDRILSQLGEKLWRVYGRQNAHSSGIGLL